MTISIVVGEATSLLGWGPEVWAGLGGALLGSGLGGAISWWLQSQNLAEQRAARVLASEERNRALGYAVVLKLSQIRDGFKNIGMHIEEGNPLKNSKEGEQPRQWWETLKPIASLPNPVHFTVDEQVLILSLNKTEILNGMLELDTAFLVTLGSLRRYDDLREKLQDQLSAFVSSVDGESVFTSLNEKEQLIFKPKMRTVSSIPLHLSEAVPQYAEAAAAIVAEALTELRLSKILPPEPAD
jgi:hypothetical protein